ncbi:MAG: C4-type zinc ribbon domain-containing protein [bacterium]
MNEQIQLLVSLQNKDTAIFELNQIIKNLPTKVEQWKQSYHARQNELNQKRKDKENVEKELRTKERRLQTIEDELKKFRARIYEVKTQKEMVSLDSEIEKAEEEKGIVEEDILKLFDANDNLANKISSLTIELEKELVELKKEEQETNRQIELNTNKLNSVTKDRDEISEKIAKETLALYEKIRAHKNNLAVVQVKDNACQGCFIKLPPQVINEVKSGSHLVRCEGCVRILYWKE